MDIDPPQGPIETWKDFFVHLCIITLGLLIALSLEAMVAHVHKRNLVREANANITAEIRDNQKELKGTLLSIAREHHEMENLLDYLEQLKQNQNAHGSATIAGSEADLTSASWTTAAATGALGYMPYRELKRYEDVYVVQQKFESVQMRSLDTWATVYGPGIRLLSTKHRASSKGNVRPTPEEEAQINALEEKVQLYIGRLTAVEDFGEGLDQAYTECLKQSLK